MDKLFSDNIKARNIEEFNKETKVLLHQRVNITVLLGAIFFPLFSILDYFVVPDHLNIFLKYRLLCCIALLGVFLFNTKTKIGINHPFVSALLAYIISAITLSRMVVDLGGYGAGYYVGLLLALVICSVILPLNVKQASLCAFLVYIIYVVPVVVFCQPDNNLNVFLNNNFFFLSVIAIISIQCWADTNTRIREFNMRMQEKEYADKLAYYAENLEKEVKKRTTELEQSEVRFRELYDNIIDDVVLLDNDGNIVLANKQFTSRMNLENSPEQNIIHFVHPDNRQIFQDKLHQAITSGKNITGMDFRMLAPEQKIIDVECNASILGAINGQANIQLLIRDVTTRKRLERELAESFSRVQDARSAVILSLAKLSEYREFDPNNRLEKFREYARMLAEELSLQEEYKGYITSTYIEDLYQSSILYDIGKVGISDKILRKKGRLTDEEREIINRHTIFGGDTIKSLESQTEGQTFLEMGKNIAYFHHERWDGQGYPQALTGDEIPLSARIVALADVYNALTSDVAYRKAYSHNEAVEIILQERGKQFAPDVLDAFVVRQENFRQTVLQMAG